MKIVLILVLSFFSFNSFAKKGLSVVAVGEAGLEKEKLTFDLTKSYSSLKPLQKKAADEVLTLLENDFRMYKNNFLVVPSTRNLIANFGSPKFERLKAKGLAYYVELNFKPSSAGLFYSMNAYRVSTRKNIAKKTGLIDLKDVRTSGHMIAALIYERVTGKRSIFKSKIAFVSDRGSTKAKPIKELYIMDFDGNNKKQLTFYKGTVISPAISHDGSKILYSLIRSGRNKNKNINLRMLNLKTGKDELISSRKGINSGAVFSPDGRSIILTLSHTGNAELYRMDLRSKRLYRLTRNYAPDVDPSISVDGSLLTFLSGRSGAAMIYTMNPTSVEKNVKRISYVGKYNATPRFSPDGAEIVFASWLDQKFDLFRISAHGTNLSRLTKDFGSNEDPTYSPDGEFLAFSNQRVISRYKAVHKVYIMDRNGEIIGSLTDNYGNCITPRWSKSL